MVSWASNKIDRDRNLKTVEREIDEMYKKNEVGYFNEEEKLKLQNLEMRKRRLLEWREVKWRMKSRVAWLELGDENIKFFHKYASHKKMINTI
jgi:hypothetical protein